MKTALIIGNGVSRKKLNLHALPPEGFTTFGCNALYREFTPDWLVALDDKIIEEINQSDFPKDRFYVPPFDEQFEPAIYNPSRPRENAGMIAMRLAIQLGYDNLELIGLDFLVEDGVLNMANIYDGTNAYGPETRASYFDCIMRSEYFRWFVKQNPTVKFKVIYPESFITDHAVRVAPMDNFEYAVF
jgi:hypothetical protein